MAMKIRLARGGSNKRPYYSIVAADSRMPRDGRAEAAFDGTPDAGVLVFRHPRPEPNPEVTS